MNVLKGFFMRLSFVVFILSAIGSNVTGQSFFNYTYNHNCSKGGLTANSILDYGVTIGTMNSGHAGNGNWDNLGGLSLVDPLVTDENAIFTGYVVGNTYTLIWNKNDQFFYTITVNVVLANAPTATFVANNPTPCSTPYDAETTISLSGGISPYDITISRAPEGDYNNTFSAGSTTINFGKQSTDRTYSLSTVSDANGCMVAGLPINASFTSISTPTPTDVIGANVCSPNSLNISIAAGDAEAGVTYYLYEETTGRVAGSDRVSAPYSWTSSTVGTYYVYAENPCDAANPILMTDGPFMLSEPPSQYAISIAEAAPYCAGNSYTVQLAKTDNGVTYTLRDPLNNPLAVVVGNGGARSFVKTVLATDGNYSVEATAGSCVTQMSNTVAVGVVPLIHNIVGGSVCDGGNLSVSLASSTGGINYTLKYNDGSSVTNLQTITPPITTFNDVNGVGSYTVLATDPSGCTSTMNGTATINTLPKTYDLNLQGNVCPSGVVSIGSLANPVESDVTYYLYKDNVYTGSSSSGASATGGILSFGDWSDKGKYTVRAVRGSCFNDMTGFLQVYETPNSLTLSVNKTKYCATEPQSNVNISILGTDPNVSYQLQKENGGSWTDEGAIKTSQTSYVWNNKRQGIYRVIASNPGGLCPIEMSNRITVTEVSEPDVLSISVIGSDRRCADETTKFTLRFEFDGNSPYSFDIVDDKGDTIATLTGIVSNVYDYEVNPTESETHYSVVNLTDVASCSAVNPLAEAIIYVDPLPNIKFSPTNPEVCKGSSIDVTADGAGVGGTYEWSDGLGNSNPLTVTSTVTDTYTVTAKTDRGCVDTETVTVVVNPLPVLTFDTPGSVYEYCENDGIVVLSGNQSGATFLGNGIPDTGGGFFDPNPNSTNVNIFSKAIIGNNIITYQYTDPKGCFNSLTKDITVNSVPTVGINNLAASYCADAGTATFFGSPNGSAPGSNGTFTIVGYETEKGNWWNEGTPTGTGTIDVGAAINAIGPKTITVRYTYEDPKTCTAFIEQNVDLLPDLNTNLNFTGLPAALCQSAAAVTLNPYLGAVSLSPVPAGASLVFSGPGTSITNNANGTATFDPSIAGAGTHTITLDYTDVNGCTGSATGSITIGTPLSLPGFGTEYCSSDAGPYTLLGSINGNPPVASDGTTFDVSSPSGAIITQNQPNGAYDFIPSTLFGNYGGGVYKVVYKYTDGTGCSNTLTTNVTIIEELDATFTIGDDPYATAQSNYCIGDNPVALKGHADLSGAKAIGSVSTNFTGNGVSGSGIKGGFFNPGDNAVKYHPTANTITHTVIHTVNGKSCPSPLETFDVYVPLVDVSISGISPTKKYCTNSGSSTINVNGTDSSNGTAVFSATKGGSPTKFLINNSGTNTATLDPSVGAGVYEITMVFTKTAATGGCSKTVVETVEVYADNPVTFSGVSDNQKICISSSPITLRGDMPSGGVGNFSIIPAVPGGISNTGTDDLGNPVVADDGDAILDPAALAIGPYTIRYDYTNAAGCSTYAEKTINIVGAPTTLFDITVTDKVGQPFGAYCDDDAAATKGVKIGLSGSNTGVTYELLFGGVSLSPKVEFTGNGLPFFFQDGTPADILFTDEGVYTVRAVQNSCDAIMNGSILVEQYELVLEQDSITNVSCTGADDGEVTLKTTGGSGTYEYSIDGGTNWQASPTFKKLKPIEYKFSVRDLSSAACEKINTLSITITEPTPVVVTELAASTVNVGCVPCTAGVDCEGSSTISITGGTPDYGTYPTTGYAISWSSGGTDFTEVKMKSGLHSVTVTDGNGCVESLNVNIGENPAITLAEDVDPTLHVDNVCEGEANGSCVVTATGGSGTYQFSLTDPSTTVETWVESNYGVGGNQYQLKKLSAGTYYVWVRDRNTKYNRCVTQVTTPIVITEPVALSLIEESQSPITCNGDNKASFIVRGSGGLSGTYQFTQTDPALGGAVWVDANNGLDGYEVTGLTYGTFTVWMRDKGNPSCNYVSLDVALADILPLSYILNEHTNVSCNSGNDGRIEVLAQGGSGNYVYNWEFPLGTSISNNNYIETRVAGDYYLTITDADAVAGCTPLTHTFTITQPINPLSINLISIKDNDCGATNNGIINIDVLGGTAPYDITWSNTVKNTESLTGLSPGSYSVSVEDASGCVLDNAATPFTVGQLADITLVPATMNLIHNNCYQDNSGSIDFQVIGGSGSYEFRLQGDEVRDWVTPVPVTSDKYTFDNLYAGTYEVLVRDANNSNCEYSLGSYAIAEPDELTLTNIPATGISHVTCNGGNDGWIAVTASGGSGNYDYSLDNGATWTNIPQINTYTFSNLVKGTYLIKVRDFNVPTCLSATTLVIDVNQPDEIKASVTNVTNTTCYSSNDGTVTVIANGGSGNYDYYCVETNTWQNDGIFNLGKGTYTFQAQDEMVAGCISSVTTPVVVGGPLDFTTTDSISNISCNGKSDGEIYLTTTFSDGSAGLFEYSIDNGLNYGSSPITGLAVGVYVVKIRDANNITCEKTLSTSVTITEPDALVQTLDTKKDVQCKGESNGEIKIKVSGGTPVYKYQWSGVSDANGGKTDHPQNLSTGAYKVSITDDHGCAILPVPSYTINEPDEIVADYTLTHIVIGGQSTGSIVINNIEGGPTTNYDVVWDDLSTNMSRTGLPSGNYSFTVNVRDASSIILCTRTYNVTLIDQSFPLDFTLTPTDAMCYGEDGSLQISISSGNPPYDISWSKGGTLVGSITTSNINTNVNLPYGVYEVNIKDNSGGDVTKTNTIDQPDEFAINAYITADKECYGDLASINIDISGDAWDNAIAPKGDNFMVEWIDPDGLTIASGTWTSEAVQVDLTKSGSYKVNVYSITSNTCVKSDVVVVSNPDPLGVIPSVVDVACFGGSDGSISITPTGRPAGHGFSYTWEQDNGSGWVLLAGETTSSIVNKPAGTYRVKIQSLSSSCNYTSGSIIINQPGELKSSVTHSDVITCYGDDSGVINLTNIQGGTEPYRYELNGSVTFLSIGTTNYNIQDLISQNYALTLLDKNGCVSPTYSVNVTEPEEMTLVVTKKEIDCDVSNSGVIELSIGGGRIVSGDQNYLVTVSPDGKADIVLNPIVNNTGLPVSVTDPKLTNLTANKYVIKVQDLNSNAVDKCILSKEVKLEHINATADVTKATCFGVNNGSIQNVQITGASSNYNFSWSSADGGTGIDNSNLDQTGLSNGTYTLTIVDVGRGSCSVDFDFVVDYKHNIDISGTVSDVICNGDSTGAIAITTTGLGLGTAYDWSGPSGFVFADNTTKDQGNLPQGTYSVALETTLDGQQCIANKDFTVSQPDPISYNAYFEYTNCEPYQRTLVVGNVKGGTGAYTYNWNGPAFTPPVPVDPKRVLITQGGMYTITVRDKPLCKVSKDVFVPNELTIDSLITDVRCYNGDNGAIDITNIYGGSGSFDFSWTGPNGFTATTRNIDGLKAGDYTLRITDKNENVGGSYCYKEFKFTVGQPQAIDISPAVVNVSCFGKSDGKIEIGVLGGVAPYNYSWSPVVGTNLADNKNQYNLPADDYTVTVTDDNLCNSSLTIPVLQDPKIVLSTNVTETICDGTGGAIDLTVNGGSGSGFKYDWSSALGTGLVQGDEDQTNLTGGTYSVKVSDLGDGRSCTATISETLTHAISVINEDVTPVTCSGNDDGAISYDVIGGDGNYTYSWNVISGDPTRIVDGSRDQSGLSEGEYEVTITDGRTDISGTNCAIKKTFTVTASTGLSVNVAVFDSKMCFGQPSGKLVATVTGGSGNYKYYWNNVVGTSVLDNQVQGLYKLKVEDVDLHCTFNQSYEIKGPDNPLNIDNIVVTPILCYGEATGEIAVTVSGGTKFSSGDYKYEWSSVGGSNAAGSNPTKLAAGTYRLTVLDANGCSVSSDEIIVSQPSTYIKVDNPQITDVSTVGGNNGQILVDVYDGTAPRSVEWFDASDTSIGTLNPATGLSSGTYRVVATDNNGCPAELTGIRVVEPGESLGFEKTVHQISPCNGGDNGEIHINRVFGGFPIDGDRYRIQITGPGTNVDIEGTSYDLMDLTPGTYRVVVTDDATETYQEDIVISEYTPLTLTTNKVSDVQCFGTATGEIEVIVGGGRPNASNNYLVEITSTEGYSDTNEDALSGVPFSFTNLPAGNYTVTLKDHAEDFDTKTPDRNNCELSDFTLITEPEANVELTSVSGLSEICQGETYNLSINTSNWDFGTQGNLRVSVYDDFTTTEYIVDQTPYIITVSPTSSRTYEIAKVADPANAACLQGETTGNQIQLTVHDLPTATITGPTEVCEDGSVQLSVSFTGKAPFSFTWQDVNNGTSNTISGVYASDTTFTDDPVANAGYIVLNVSDDYSCSNAGNGQVDVTINNKPIITFAGSTDICAGESTSLTFGFNENNAPYTITYEANGSEGTLLVTPDTDNKYTWNVTPVVTTIYKITSVVDANGCTMDINVPVQATIIVDQLPEPLSTIESTTDNGEVCQGLGGFDYSVDSVKYATNYVWAVESGMTITSGNGTTGVTVDFDRSFAGGYIRVYAENACGVNTTIERWVNAKVLPDPILIAPSGDQNLCEGETGLIYSIDPVANATSYEWSLPTGLILQGSGTGTSIIVDLDPNVPSTIGDIKVRPVNSCSSDEPWSPPLEVTITPLPVADAGSDERICLTTYTFDAAPLKAGESGLWKILNGSGQYVNRSVDQVRPDAHVYNLSQGANTFLWTVTNDLTGCYTSDTVVIYNDQVTVNAIASSDKVCDGKVQLFGTPLNSVINADEAYWSTTGGAFIVSSTNENTNVTDLDPGSNSFTWTIRKGACYSTATVNVINNKPTEALIYNASDVIITLQDLPCQTDFTSLRGSKPASDETGYWRIESGSLTIDNVNSPTISVTNIAKGDHEISWNIRKGDCLSKSIVTIRNNALDVDAGVDKYSCDGTTTLYGTEIPVDASGQWSVIEGFGNFVSGNSATTDVTALAQENSGKNVFRWTLTRNGCASFDSVVITNNQTSPAEISGGSSTISICDYEYNLHAVTPVYGDGVWSVVSGQGRFDNSADPNTMVRNVAHGDNVFRWTVSNNTCSSYVDFTITNLHVDAYAGADTAVCGKVAKLNATPAPSGASGLWTIVSGAGGVVFNPSSGSATASATSLGYGTNTLVWTVTQKGCVSTDTVNVLNNQPYEVSATSYIYVDDNRTTLRAEDPKVGKGLWTLLEGRGTISNPNSSTTTVTNLLPNFNYFRWTVTNVGCVDYVDVAVQSGVLAEADAGLDQLHLCEDFTSLQANEPEGTYGEWTIVKGSAVFESSNSAKTKISDIHTGINVFRWTLRFAGGSENFTTDTVVIINNKPSDANGGIDIIECGDATILNARTPSVGSPTWSVLSGGGVFVNDTDPKTAVTGLAKGENIFKYEVKKDVCFSYDTISVFNYEASDAFAGNDQVVCVDSATLNPEIPKYGIGKWRIIEGSGKGRDENGNPIDEIGQGYVYDLAPGINKLIWEVKVPLASASCIKRDTLTIVNNKPSLSFAGHNRPICTDTVSLSGSVPVYGKGTWTLISGSGIIADSTQRNTLVTNLGKGKNRFRWAIDNNGCTSVSDVEISNNLIEAFAGYDQVNCMDSAILEGNNPVPGEGTWGILGGSGSANFDNNESPYTQVRNLDKGVNILTWTITHQGCQSVSQVSITNNKPSAAIAGDNKATCDSSIVLGASVPEVGTGKWTIRSGGGYFTDEYNASTAVDTLKFGKNVFRWTVENEGCILYDDVEISYNTIQASVGSTQEICENHTFLEANNASPGIGTWSVVGGTSQARFANTNDPVSEVYDLAKGTNRLKWSINNQGCITSAEVSVINHSPSTAYAGNTQELCQSNTILDATKVDVGTGSWEVLTGSATITADQINEEKAVVSGLSKGDNVFRWTVTSDNGLCTSVDEITVINNEPSEPYAGASEEYCDPTVVLKAATPDFGIGNWSIIEGGGNFNDPTLPDATISNLTEGDNVLRWTITQGQCMKHSDITITNNTPTTANAGPDIEDCKDYAFLNANVPTQGDGFWTLISGNARYADATNENSRVDSLTFGENILQWNIQKGSCISSDQITIFNQIPDQAKAGNDRSTCEDYLTLNANNPNSGIGTWTVISGHGDFEDASNPTSIVRNLGLGENRFKWTVAYGTCTTEDVVEIVSNKADPYAGEDDVTYETSYELKASNPGDLGATWSVIAGAGEFVDETYFNTIVNDLNVGVNTFRWRMDVNGCITYDDVSIEYREVPDAKFIADTTQGCYPLTIQFTNHSDGGSVFNWDFGDGNTSTDRNPVHTFYNPGKYLVTMVAPGPDNVDGEYQMDINVHDHPVAEFSYSPDIIYIPDDLLRCYSLSVDAERYLWDFGDEGTSTDVNPLHIYKEEGVYDLSLIVENKYGCLDTIVKPQAITTVLQGFVTFPNSFMPRPDGGNANSIGGGETNTVFRPIYRDVDQYQIQIFNRWGQLIFESSDIDEGWNGFYNGTLAPQAVYVWKVKGTFNSGKVFNEAGSVLLVR